MKSDKPSIKIIKRAERESASREVAPRVEKEDGPVEFTRKATSTVTGWVREFQRRQASTRGV